MIETLFLVTFSILLVLGILISFVPGIPGMVYLLAVSAVFSIIDRFDRLDYRELGILAIVALIVMVLDFLCGALGAKWGGARLSSIFAGFAGMIIGTFFIPLPIIGSIIGFIAGIFIAEYSKKHNVTLARKAAIGGFLGALAGTSINVIGSLVFIILFFVFIF